MKTSGLTLVQADEQDFVIADDLFVKVIPIPAAGSIVPQHAHRYDHVTFLARGALYAWVDGRLIGRFDAPKALVIAAGCKHTFQTVEDDTTILCIHNAMRPDVAAIVAENVLTEADIEALRVGG